MRNAGPGSGIRSVPGSPQPIGPSAANRTFDQFGEAVAAYEASLEVNPFSSKYDSMLAGKIQFTADEKRGYDLFRSATTH